MERNILEELAIKLSAITLEGATDRVEHNLKAFFEEICCRNKIRVECDEHFLNNSLMFTLHENVKSNIQDKIYSTIVLIADMAKYEITRDYLSNIYLVCLLVDKMKREKDYFIRLQTCRALANMCYEHAKTQRLIMGQNPLESVFSTLDISCTPHKRENNQRFREVIVALILNLLAENERVMEEVADKYVPVLIKALESDLKNRVPTLIAHNIFVAIVTLTEVKPPEIIFSLKVCLLVVDMYRRTSVFDYAVPGLEFLEDAELPDITKYQLVEAGIFDVFMWALEHKPEDLTDEEQKKYELLGRVLANILSGDEAMAYIYDINNAQIVNRFGAWLSSPDNEIVHIGALCLGNIARSDSNSMTIVERGIHKQLIQVVMQNSEDIRLLYATVSTLRNLCLAKANKKELITDGMVEVLLPLLDLEVRTTSPVIYKAIGAVRQVIEGQEEITIRLGTDAELVRKLVKWSTTTLLPWVSTECSRFLCSLVNISKDRNVMINLIENGGYNQMARMLGALHGLMQREALACMTVTVATSISEANRQDFDQLSEAEKEKSKKLANFHSVLLECQFAEKLKHMIAQHGAKMEPRVLDECLTFLEEVLKIKQIRINLYYEGFKGVFHYVMRNREDYQRVKERVEEIENCCKFY